MFWLTVLNQVEPALVLIRPTLASASQGITKVPNITCLAGYAMSHPARLGTLASASAGITGNHKGTKHYLSCRICNVASSPASASPQTGGNIGFLDSSSE